jgi:hypothetical protein
MRFIGTLLWLLVVSVCVKKLVVGERSAIDQRGTLSISAKTIG